MRNQVTLYVPNHSLHEPNPNEKDEHSTTFLLTYVVTVIDDLRSTVISLQNPPCNKSMCRGQEQGAIDRRPSAGTQLQGAERVEGGRKDKLPRCAKHKRRHGLRGESASYSYLAPIMAEAEKYISAPMKGIFGRRVMSRITLLKMLVFRPV